MFLKKNMFLWAPVCGSQILINLYYTTHKNGDEWVMVGMVYYCYTNITDQKILKSDLALPKGVASRIILKNILFCPTLR